MLKLESFCNTFVKGCAYKSYNSIAHYIFMMYAYNITVKQAKKAVRTAAIKNDVYIASGNIQNESAVANILLNAAKLEETPQAQKDFAAPHNKNIMDILTAVDDNGESLTSRQYVAKLAEYLQDNALNYRTVIKQFKETPQAETETPQVETETPQAETETPQAETETPQAAASVTLESVMLWIESPETPQKALESAAVAIAARLNAIKESAPQKASRKRRAA